MVCAILGPDRSQDPDDAVGTEFGAHEVIRTRLEMAPHPFTERARHGVRCSVRLSKRFNTLDPERLEIPAVVFWIGSVGQQQFVVSKPAEPTVEVYVHDPL